MNKFVRFESGDNIVCIKGYKTLVPGHHYVIKGCGDLEFNLDPEVGGKIGFGFCVEDGMYGSYSGRKDWWRLPHGERVKWYYFTKDEMSDYFITQEEDFIARRRDIKLKSLGV